MPVFVNIVNFGVCWCESSIKWKWIPECLEAHANAKKYTNTEGLKWNDIGSLWRRIQFHAWPVTVVLRMKLNATFKLVLNKIFTPPEVIQYNNGNVLVNAVKISLLMKLGPVLLKFFKTRKWFRWFRSHRATSWKM